MFAGFLRSIDRPYKKFYRLLVGTQAFNHFIHERSFGSDRVGTLTSRRSGDLAFFDECVQQIDEYDSETSFIEFDDVLPPRFVSDSKDFGKFLIKILHADTRHFETT